MKRQNKAEWDQKLSDDLDTIMEAADEGNSPSSPVARGYAAQLEAARAMYWWNRQQPSVTGAAPWEDASARMKAIWFEKAGEYIEQRRAA